MIQCPCQKERTDTMSNILETVMLICFGLSWPTSAYKNYQARTAKSTSLPFILLILVGYLAGITAKIINGNCTYVLFMYFINLVMILLNLAVYIRKVFTGLLNMPCVHNRYFIG